MGEVSNAAVLNNYADAQTQNSMEEQTYHTRFSLRLFFNILLAVSLFLRSFFS